MKVLYFSREYTTHDRRFLQSLAASGCCVHYLRLEDSGVVFEQRALPVGVQAIDWKAGRISLRSFRGRAARLVSLTRILRELRPDVVLAGPLQTSTLMAALAGARPLVAMSWGSDVLVDAERSAWARLLTCFALRRSVGVLGDCQAVREKVHSLAPGYPEAQIVTFPWGIALEDFKPGPSCLALRTELGWEEQVVLISTRTWEPGYAIDALVQAFAALHGTHPEARLILLGDGSQEEEIRRLIANLGLQSVIHAPGRIAYTLLPEYFRLADIYVSSALSDGTSISLLEAMACGLPVVVADGYGNVEWVHPDENGWLVSPGDPDALAEALAEALIDRERRKTFGARNAALARERANWGRNFPQLLDLFDRVQGTSVRVPVSDALGSGRC